MDNGAKLARLVGKALDKLNEILELPLQPGDEDYLKLIAAQQSAATTLLNTGTKTDENRFREKVADRFVELLDRLRQEETELNSLVLDNAPSRSELLN